jgi:hypothetical protein
MAVDPFNLSAPLRESFDNVEKNIVRFDSELAGTVATIDAVSVVVFGEGATGTTIPYSVLTGTPVNLSNFANDAGYLITSDIGVNIQAFDATLLNNADIGVSVQAFDATLLNNADIGVSVQAFDATLLNDSNIGVSVQAFDATIVVDADIGVNIQAFDATIVVDADIGVSVQAFDATLLNDSNIGVSVQAYDDTLLNNADISVNIQAFDPTLLNNADIGVNVQAFDATLLNNADIGVNVQAYDATLLTNADIGVSVQAFDANATLLNNADIGVNVQAYDATILNGSNIGVSVQAFDATLLNDAAIGVSVQAYDDTLLNNADISVNIQAFDPTLLNNADIGVSVQAYDATIVVDADIGVSVQAFDATMLNDSNIGVSVQAYDATMLNDSNIGVSVQAFDATILNDAAIGVSVQAFDATILNDAAIGVSVQAFDATILNNADVGVSVQAFDATIVVDADIGVSVQAFDATIVVDADIGVSVQAFDATLLNDADIGVSVQAFDATLLNDAELTNAIAVKAINQSLTTTDSPTFSNIILTEAGLTFPDATVLTSANSPIITARNAVQNQDPVSQGTSTRSGMSSALYTGNSSTQSIATGIDMDTGDFGGLVWLKGRTLTSDHNLYDTVRGVERRLEASTTETEISNENTLTSFNSTGFSVGDAIRLNRSGDDYAVWSWQTTEKTTGTTNRGKAYECHYNADLGFSIVGYEGDGVDGHEISHFLGKEPELNIFKRRDSTGSWTVQSSLLDTGQYFYLNATAPLANNGTVDTLFSSTTFTVSSSTNFNGSTADYIAYNFTSIPNVCKIDTYIGLGAAGKYVPCGFNVGWLLIKGLTSASAWAIFDGSRGADKLLQPHLSSAEITGTTDIQFVDGGFVLTNTSSTTNALNKQYIFMAYAEGTAFDGTKTLTNYPYATTDEVLTINEGTLMSFAEGFSAIGQANTEELVGAGVTLSFGAGYENQTRYVYKDKAGVYSSTQYRPLEGISRAQADKFGVVSPLNASTRTTDKHFGPKSATGVVLSSSTYSSTAPPWNAFNKITYHESVANRGWLSVINPDFSNTFLQYKFSEPRIIESLRLLSNAYDTNGSINVQERSVNTFITEVSHNGLTWTTLDNTYASTKYPMEDFQFGPLIVTGSSVAYDYVRVKVTSNNGDAYLGIGEVEINTITPSDYYNVVDGLVYGYTGGELVTNGTFDTNIAGWTALHGTLTFNSGVIDVARSGGVGLVAYQDVAVQIGKTYELAFVLVGGSGNDGMVVTDGALATGTQLGINRSTIANSTLSFTFTATTNVASVVFEVDNDGTTSSYDSISLKQVDSPIDSRIDRVYLAKIMTGARGELLNYENLPVAKTKGVDAELQGNLVVHGDISNRGVATAIGVVDQTRNPHTFIAGYNVSDYVDVGTGQTKVIFETPMDDISYAVSGSVHNPSAPQRFIVASYNHTRESFIINANYDNNTLYNRVIAFSVYGGRKII